MDVVNIQKKHKGTIEQSVTAAMSSQRGRVGRSSPTSPAAVSSNWKNLAKQLGLDASRSKRDRPLGDDRRRTTKGSYMYLTSKSASTRKRRKETAEAPQPKRRKMDESSAGNGEGGGMVAGTMKEMWTDGVCTPGLAQQTKSSDYNESSLVTGRDTSAGRCVSLDCEMVGTGPEGDFSMLARCSVVNHHGNILYDSYVAPMDKITDYRTKFSGITPHHLGEAPDFKSVQKEVSDLITERILVGHAIHHDLKALLLSHPRKDIRDTSKFKTFRQLSKGKTPSLKKLAKEILDLEIQQHHHDSIEDARVAMRLYQTHKKEWETMVKAKRKRK